MTSTLKKHLELPLPNGEVVGLDVTMRTIEIIERVWDKSLDAVISDLTNGANVKRSLVAETIAQWIPPATLSLSRRELKEAIMCSDAEKFGAYAGVIWAAAMYSVRYIDEESFDKALKGVSGLLSKKTDEETGSTEKPPKKGGGRQASQSKRTTS